MSNTQPVSISLRGMTKLPAVGPFHPLVLDTTDGIMESRLYEADQAKAAILWLGEAEGEFPSPADGLYERLAERYQSFGVTSLRLQYRNPSDFAGLSLDVLVGAFVLQQLQFERVVVVGHGIAATGAVQAGITFPFVTGVALLAPRGIEPQRVAGLSPTPLLVLHGTEDKIVPTQRSRELIDQAQEPKRIYYYQRTGHDFRESVDALTEDLTEWLNTQLGLSK